MQSMSAKVSLPLQHCPASIMLTYPSVCSERVCVRECEWECVRERECGWECVCERVWVRECECGWESESVSKRKYERQKRMSRFHSPSLYCYISLRLPPSLPLPSSSLCHQFNLERSFIVSIIFQNWLKEKEKDGVPSQHQRNAYRQKLTSRSLACGMFLDLQAANQTSTVVHSSETRPYSAKLKTSLRFFSSPLICYRSPLIIHSHVYVGKTGTLHLR